MFKPCSSGTKVCTGDFAPPEPEFRAEFWETNFGRPNFGPEFLGRIFCRAIWLTVQLSNPFSLSVFHSLGPRTSNKVLKMLQLAFFHNENLQTWPRYLIYLKYHRAQKRYMHHRCFLKLISVSITCELHVGHDLKFFFIARTCVSFPNM